MDGDGYGSCADRSRAVIAEVQEFLGGPRAGAEGLRFEFGAHLESNWGAVYGGALAAAVVTAARSAAPDRSPRSVHLQIVRSVPLGSAVAVTRVRHAGRTVTTMEVEIFDNRDKLGVIGLVTMVTPDAIAWSEHDTRALPLEIEQLPMTEGAWTPAVTQALAMVGTGFDVTNLPTGVDGSPATGLSMDTPWDELDLVGPEAACLLADAVIAAPLTQRFGFEGVVGPNTDLSLRFTTAPATRQVDAIATMHSIQHGTVTVGIDVRAGEQFLAHGLATSLLLDRTERLG